MHWQAAAAGGGGGSNPPPAAANFEGSLQDAIKQGTCDTIEPVPTNQVSVSLASDQDTAEPRDLSMVTVGCKQ